MRQASVFDYQLLYWFSAWDNALQNSRASAFSPFFSPDSSPFPFLMLWVLFLLPPFFFCLLLSGCVKLQEHCSVWKSTVLSVRFYVICWYQLMEDVVELVVFFWGGGGGGYWFPLICWYAHISVWGLRVSLGLIFLPCSAQWFIGRSVDLI